MLLLAAFVAVHAQILFLDQTTMLPLTAAYGTLGDTEQPRALSNGTVDRPIRGDVTGDATGTEALYPFDHLALSRITRFEIPFWNPYTLTGLPFLAEFQWGVFYPPNWTRVLIPQTWWDLYSAAHILVLAFLVTCIGTVTNGDRAAATVGGVATLGIGYLLIYFPTHTIITPIPSGALVILGAELLAQDPRRKAGALAVGAGVYGLATAGHPTPAIFLTTGILLFVLFRVVLDRRTLAALRPLLLASCLAFLLALPNVGPFVVYVVSSKGQALIPWDRPNFFGWVEGIQFLMPYALGPLNHPHPAITAAGMNLTPAFLLVPPFVFFLSFLGACDVFRRRVGSLMALSLAACVLVLWAFGVPPVSWVSQLPLLKRLSFNYVWPFPALVLCVLAGFGVRAVGEFTASALRRLCVAWLTGYAVIFLAFVWLLHSLGAISAYFANDSLVWRGLAPSLCFGLGGPLIVLALSTFMQRSGRPAGGLLLAVALSGTLFNIAAVYPNANLAGAGHLAIAAFTGFCLTSLVLACVAWMKPIDRPFRFASVWAVVAVVFCFSLVANTKWPGLHARYALSSTPAFVEYLRGFALDWRAYGMSRAIPVNNLVRYDTSAVNNQNALVPEQLRRFVSAFLDAGQAPTTFFGFSVDGSDGTEREYVRNLRFWRYLAVRHVVVRTARHVPVSDFLGGINREAIPRKDASIVVVPTSGPPLALRFECSDGRFDAIGVRLGNFGRRAAGRVVISARDGATAPTLAVLDSAGIRDAHDNRFQFDRELCTQATGHVDVEISNPGGGAHGPVAVWRFADGRYALGRIWSTVNGDTQNLPPTFIDSSAGITVFEDTRAEPRAYYSNRFVIADGWKSAQEAFGSQRNLRDVVYGESGQAACASSDIDPRESEVKVTSIRSSAIELQARLPGAGVVVLVDTYAPGWRASIDGLAVPVIRVNGTFRGVCIDRAGTYAVEMTYRPPFWTAFVAGSAAGLLGLLGSALMLFVRGRQRAVSAA